MKPEWQSIETAPKDGTPVDLWIPASAKGNESGKASRSPNCSFHEGLWKLGGDFELSWLQEATHWMPLPEPPK